MKKLVHKLSYRPICETHTCSNAAEFGIGLDGFPATWTHYCQECFAIMARDGMKLIEESPEFDGVLEKLAEEEAAEEKRKREYEERERLKAEQQKELERLDRERAEKIETLAKEESVTYGEKITDEKAAELEKAAAELQEQSKTDFEAKAIQNKAKVIVEKAAEQAKAEAEAEALLKEEADKNEYYVCKRCGEKFLKPDQLTQYRTHTIRCSREKKDDK